MVEATVRTRLETWRQLLTTQVVDGRQLLRELLTGPLRFFPEHKTYRFEGEVGLEGCSQEQSLCTIWFVPNGNKRLL